MIVCNKDGTIRYFSIPDYDSTVKTSFRVVRYERGSTFTKALDSTERVVTDSFYNELLVEESKEYDIVLLPQNRRHRLANIHFGNENRRGSAGLESDRCQASITFTYDGEVIKQLYWINFEGASHVVLKL